MADSIASFDCFAGQFSHLIGSIGVGLLLLAFFLSVFKIISQESRSYLSMNLIGAGLSCYASHLIDFMPFVVLEGTWALVALIGIIKTASRKGTIF